MQRRDKEMLTKRIIVEQIKMNATSYEKIMMMFDAGKKCSHI